MGCVWLFYGLFYGLCVALGMIYTVFRDQYRLNRGLERQCILHGKKKEVFETYVTVRSHLNILSSSFHQE